MTGNSRITDMTVGNPTKHILLFALPMFMGNMFQQLYNMVDTIIVGKYVNADALAATGACSSLCFLFFSLSSGLAIGIGIIVSQYFGAKDDEGVRMTIANSCYVLAAVSVLTSLLGMMLARPLLLMLSTPANILEDAVIYLRTTCCGIIFIAAYNGVAAVLRALGDSKTPLIFLIFSTILNICMDLFFVIYLDKGVFGVAIATVISQAICAVISIIYAIIKIPYFKLTKEEMQPQRPIIRRCFELGLPMALQSSMIAVSLIVLQGVVNKFGSTVMAAYTISGKVDIVVSQLFNAISASLTTYAGQNLGAGKLDRVQGGFHRGHIITLIYNLIVSPIIFIFSSNIARIFVNDPSVIEFSSQAIRITSVMYPALGAIYIPRGTLNGCGDAKFSLINGVTEVICRIVYAYALTAIASIGMWGIWFATGLTWITVAIICNGRYLKGSWKYLKPVKR